MSHETTAGEPALYLGLMSGTSADAIDAVLVEFHPQAQGLRCTLHASHRHRYPGTVREQILAISQAEAGSGLSADALGRLDTAIGQCFAHAASGLLTHAGVDTSTVRAIGSHGQTLRHHPHGVHPFTLQLGDPHVIAEHTGIDVVADFRRRDVAAGGQGAPLVPGFHAALFAATEPVAVLNLGGIANLSLLAPETPVRGFDTGPANALLDAWVQRHYEQPFDADGALAAGHAPDAALLQRLLADPYFARAAPKSTGRDHFHLDWLRARTSHHLPAHTVLATLVELTAVSVAEALQREAPATRQVWVCGGGVHNPILLARLQALLAPRPVRSTALAGVDPDAMEAMAFAWLAHEFLAGRPGNRAEVTGARGPRRLGALFPAR